MELIAWMHGVSAIAAGLLVASVWQGLLLAAMVWVCLALAPKIAASIRFSIWAATFVAIAALPFLPFAMSHFGAGGVHLGAGVAAPVLQLDLRWAVGLAVVWLTASLVRAAGFARGLLRLRALWMAAMPVDAPASLGAVLAGDGGRRSAQLFSSAEVDQPCVIGFFAPRILVPEWLLGSATAAELEQIVRHEVAHLRRFDDWTNLLQKLMLVAFPLNPGLAWAEKRLCSEREAACDESVIRATRAPREYALCLANLAGQRMDRRLGARVAGRESAVLSLGAWERRSELAGRIYGILRAAEGLNPMKARALMAALLVAITGGAVKLGNSAQLVSFVPEREVNAGLVPAMFGQAAAAPSLRYRDVVFREPAAAKPVLLRSAVSSRPMHAKKGTTSKAVLGSVSAPVVPVLRRVSLPVDGTQSWLIVSRWTISPNQGAPVFVIDQFFRISASSAGQSPQQSQSGWFFVQL
jgi:beta-lactamase regulating signal transducer with metallopeptidase domain